MKITTNPLIRTQWKLQRRHLAFAGAVAAIASAIAWIYFLDENSYGGDFRPYFWMQVTLLKTGLCMLAAAGGADSSVASDRDRGLLESNQLTPMTSERNRGATS